ncbi:lipoprotein-releasing ABC transporter permease subunit [Psychrobacter sp. AH5]|uniref:lipoprotein-releasing ABC transporter permease subunit n=1 Tax=Psychrobacter sp. AH5 TaxID=2937433 RepID=UPI0033414E0F
MRRPLPLFIGLRFTRSKNANKFLSFISVVSMAGLILGVAALIVVTSVLNGFEQALSSRILGMVPQVSIYSSQPLQDWKPYAQQIQDNDSNVIGAAPFVQARGMLSIAGEVNSTILNGIEPRYDPAVSILKENMIAGDLDSLATASGNIILGKYTVDKFGLELGDEVSIIISKPSDSSIGMTPTFHTYTLTGIFHVSQELDKWMSYIAMDDASDVLNLSHGAVAIRLNLQDVFVSKQSADKALANATNTLQTLSNPPTGLNFTAGDWTQTHGSLYSAIRVQKTIMSLLLFLIILVAAFNVVSTLVMSVTDKRSDVAILKTFGASSQLISRIFMIQGAVLGAFGIIMGLLLGLFLSLSIPSVSAWINSTFSLGLFDNYFVEELPSDIQLLDVVVILVSSLAMVLLSTIYPSRSAARIEPVKALKGE